MALTRMLQRRGTATQWADVANSVILAPGEIGLVVPDSTAITQSPDVGKFKIGDGVKTWSQLSYRFDDAQNQAKYSRLVATQTFEGSQVVTPANATTIPLVVAGKTSQSAHLQEWRDVSGNVLGYVGPDGLLSTKGATFNANVEMNNYAITGLKNIDGSSTGSYAVNKQYVDDAIAGLAWKTPVNLVSLETGTDLEAWIDVPLTGNTGTVELDGHDPLTQTHGNNYRLLLLNQTTPENDGIWIYSDNGTTYTLNRATDSNTLAELKGASVFVQEGDLYGTSSFVQTNHYLSDWDEQNWVQFNGASQINADGGLTKIGNTLAVGAGNGITVNADNVAISSGGVTSDMIANGTIVNEDINESAAIDKTKIAGTAVTQADTGTVTSTMIANDTILDIDIHSNAAINKNKIAGVAVTQADTQTVTSAMIVNDTIVNTDINTNAAIAQSKIANLVNDLANRSLTSHTHAIDDLSDVVITNDPSLGTPKDRQVIKYKGAPINKWVNELPSGGISIGATPPVDAAPGDAWFDSTDGSLYVYYDDGTDGIDPIEIPLTSELGTASSGFRLKLDYQTSYSSITDMHTIYYTLSAVTGPSSYITNLSIVGTLDLEYGDYATSQMSSVNLWSGSGAGPQTWPANSTTVLTNGSYNIPFIASTDSYFNIFGLVDYATGSLPPYLDISSYPQYLASGISGGSSAQWVQVKANSALEASILTRLSAVEARDTKLEAANAVRVANQAERDSVYPAPVQGNTVFRADLGYEEKYYAAYNATTNPDGTTGTIGWYRYAGGAPLSENKVINGALDYWQRGAGAFSGNNYNADRFLTFNYSGTSNTTQVTLPYADAATLGTGGAYMLRITPGTVGDMGLMHRIEDVRTFAGQTVTLSFWAKTTSGTTNFQYVNLSQEFGTGGSTSVYSTVNMQSLSLTTSWKRFVGTVSLASISGKTLGAGNMLQLRIDLDETFTGAGIDFTGFQVELGPVATPFHRNQENPQAELAACQRYYFRVTDAFISNARSSIDLYNQLYRFPVPMRISPTLESGATFRASAGNNGSPQIGTATGESTLWGIYLYNMSNNWTANAEVFVTFGASAEL